MRRTFIAAAVLATLSASGCSDGQAETAATSSTTQSLLAAVDTNEVSGRPEVPQQGPEIDIATLGFDRGDEDALVRVVELSDFGCSYCRQFHEETFPALLEEFIDAGTVEWKFMPFINGMFENSLAATEAAECALEQGDEHFQNLADRLWRDQSDWKGSSEPEVVLSGMARDVGVDVDEMEACMADDRRLDRIIASTQLARQLGVRGTPTFFVVGYPPLQGALPLELFQDVLSAAVEEAGKAAGG